MTNRKTFTTITVNADGGMVHNPIVNALWISKYGTTYSIPYNGPDSYNGSIRLSVNSPIAKSNYLHDDERTLLTIDIVHGFRSES